MRLPFIIFLPMWLGMFYLGVALSWYLWDKIAAKIQQRRAREG